MMTKTHPTKDDLAEVTETLSRLSNRSRHILAKINGDIAFAEINEAVGLYAFHIENSCGLNLTMALEQTAEKLGEALRFLNGMQEPVLVYKIEQIRKTLLAEIAAAPPTKKSMNHKIHAFMIGQGESPNYCPALHRAVAAKDLAAVHRQLLGRSPDFRASNGSVAMHWIPDDSDDSLAILDLLLKQGSIHCQDTDGDTPLHVAVRLGNVRVIEKMLAHGADATVKDRQGKNCFDSLVESEHGAEKRVAISDALNREAWYTRGKRIGHSQGGEAPDPHPSEYPLKENEKTESRE